MIGGASPTHMSRRGAETLDVGIHRMLALSVTQPLAQLVARLNEFRPDHLYGYPSIIAPLADEQLAGRLRLRPEVVITSSEPLTPALRERLHRGECRRGGSPGGRRGGRLSPAGHQPVQPGAAPSSASR
jgi:hypothetical protein